MWKSEAADIQTVTEKLKVKNAKPLNACGMAGPRLGMRCLWEAQQSQKVGWGAVGLRQERSVLLFD